MTKLPKVPTRTTAVSIEAGWRALDAASTPRQIRDVAKMAEVARQLTKVQGDALAQQNAWAKLRIAAWTKLGEILSPFLTRHRHRKSVEGHDTFRLKDAGISRDQSALAQRLAGVSEAVRLLYFSEAEQEGREITVSGLLEKADAVKNSQHFTDRDEAKRLYEVARRVIAKYGIKFDCWLEPSAGDGAFFDLLPVDRRLGIDIDSPRPDIVQADFLAFDGFSPGVTYAAIGNFPWGENGAVRCFNRCADHCSVIASLVPLSFLRPHAINQLDRRFHLLHEERSQSGQFAAVFQIWVRRDELREPIETPCEHPDFEFLSRNRPDLREAADIVIRRIGVHAGKILNPSDVTRPYTAHWIKCRPGIDVEKVRARFRAIDWSDSKYIVTSGSYGAHGYRSLAMGAVIDEYERCKTRALTDIWHQAPEMVADWMIADDHVKAAEVWRALGEQLGLYDQGKKQEWYMRMENQAQRDEPETLFNLSVIDRAKGWDTWHSKLAWLDGLSSEDMLRESPALLGDFDDWLDQVLGVTQAWKKTRVRPV